MYVAGRDKLINDSSNQPKTLRCSCSECHLPFAHLQNGVLVIQSRHHGVNHKNRISLDELRMLHEGQMSESRLREIIAAHTIKAAIQDLHPAKRFLVPIIENLKKGDRLDKIAGEILETIITLLK